MALNSFSTIGVYLPTGGIKDFLQVEKHMKDNCPDGATVEWFMPERAMHYFLDLVGMDTLDFYSRVPEEWLVDNPDKAVALGLLRFRVVRREGTYDPCLMYKWLQGCSKNAMEEISESIMKAFPKTQAVFMDYKERAVKL
jgi:hypothetical protein